MKLNSSKDFKYYFVGRMQFKIHLDMSIFLKGKIALREK